MFWDALKYYFKMLKPNIWPISSNLRRKQRQVIKQYSHWSIFSNASSWSGSQWVQRRSLNHHGSDASSLHTAESLSVKRRNVRHFRNTKPNFTKSLKWVDIFMFPFQCMLIVTKLIHSPRWQRQNGHQHFFKIVYFSGFLRRWCEKNRCSITLLMTTTELWPHNRMSCSDAISTRWSNCAFIISKVRFK